MKNEINALFEVIKKDYAMFMGRVGDNAGRAVNERMIADFNEGLRFEEGRKYVKVITGNSVWGFIVAVENDKKFRKGDILKAAGWNAPARNAPRGNIIDGGYDVRWTGPNYLV
jgi:hypothetical protein